MLDLHIILHPNNAEFHNEALNSLELAVSRASFPINVFKIEAGNKGVWENRMAGYAMGDSYWKTSMDDDDILDPNGLQCLYPYLGSPNSVLCTGHKRFSSRNGVKKLYSGYTPEIMHMIVVGSPVIAKMQEYRDTNPTATPVKAVQYLVERGGVPWTKIPYDAYWYRIGRATPGKSDRDSEFQTLLSKPAKKNS